MCMCVYVFVRACVRACVCVYIHSSLARGALLPSCLPQAPLLTCLWNSDLWYPSCKVNMLY